MPVYQMGVEKHGNTDVISYIQEKQQITKKNGYVFLYNLHLEIAVASLITKQMMNNPN